MYSVLFNKLQTRQLFEHPMQLGEIVQSNNLLFLAQIGVGTYFRAQI